MSIVLYPTEVCQWQALVSEAQQEAYVTLNESVESYLVFMLMRFLRKRKFSESILALDFLEAFDKPNPYKIKSLKEVGDKSLLICGLYSKYVTCKFGSPSYFVNLGRNAYYQVSLLENFDSDNNLFDELYTDFLAMQNVLHYISLKSDTVDRKF